MVKNISICYIIIPGNPGIGDYYRSLATELRRVSQFDIAVKILTYQGFSNQIPCKLFTIQEECEYLLGEIQTIILENPDYEFVLVGHSIGGWILLKAMERIHSRNHSEWTRIRKCLFVFPFLATNKNSKQQRFLGWLVKRKRILVPIAMFFYHVFRYAINSTRKFGSFSFMKKFLQDMDKNSFRTTWKFFIQKGYILKSIVYCARSEFEYFDKKGMEEYKNLLAYSEKIAICFNRNDFWAPMSHYEWVAENLPKASCEVIDSVTHDFCTTKKGNQILSRWILKF